MGIRSLSRPPQLEVLLADERVQLISQFGGEVGDADEFKHIGEVPETMWRTDPGGQLELHQSWERQERGTNATNDPVQPKPRGLVIPKICTASTSRAYTGIARPTLATLMATTPPTPR